MAFPFKAELLNINTVGHVLKLNEDMGTGTPVEVVKVCCLTRALAADSSSTLVHLSTRPVNRD